MNNPLFRCSACGGQSSKAGKCPNCGKWNTLSDGGPALLRVIGGVSGPTPICDIVTEDYEKILTGVEGLDEVLDGGLVKGSVTLIGGEPGTGKSTLLLMVANHWADSRDETVLYISGEETAEQINLRGKRLGTLSKKLLLFGTHSLQEIQTAVQNTRPTLLIVDSVQSTYDNQTGGAVGSTNQCKAVAARITETSKKSGIVSFLVCHITKSGDLAGPSALEHIVDTSLVLECTDGIIRKLKPFKNRFGATDKTASFCMASEGLIGVEEEEDEE